MIKFLLHRPVAVFMATLAFLLLGIVASVRIPTSLMPDIAIPEITVQVSYPNNTARELETNVIRPLRNQLLQISKLKDIQSETRDGLAVIRLLFEYGVNTDFAFIETNEKVDGALNVLPRDLERPRVIKASATDIPVLNLTAALKEDYSDERFLELSDFAETVLKKRVEQLPDVALADMSGQTKAEIRITPNKEIIQSLGISGNVITNAIRQNNFELGNLLVQNGIYQYNFKFANPLRTKTDIENVHLTLNGRLLQIKDIARVNLVPQQDLGLIYSNGKRALVMAIIKQSDARVYGLKESLGNLITSFEEDYPELEFNINQDQTQLLKLSIDNLKSSLWIGSILAILIMFFFLKDFKSPLIIAISIPVSLIISLLLLYLAGLSINIISLSGLILGVGMMIDNSIIVIDNITQKLELEQSLMQVCIVGTNEIITPLISSVLTTCSVFLPLVFLSGITGALFYDQALAVSIGLVSSLIVSIILIPVIYQQLKGRNFKIEKWLRLNVRTQHIESAYEKGCNFLNKKKYIVYGVAIVFTIVGIGLFGIMSYQKLPTLNQNETLVILDWSENINVVENQQRINRIFQEQQQSVSVRFSQIGTQQFLLQRETAQGFAEAKIYIKAETVDDLVGIKKSLTAKMKEYYPRARMVFTPPKNLFEYVFGGEKEHFTAQVSSRNSSEVPKELQFQEIKTLLNTDNANAELQETATITILHENVLLYKVEYIQLLEELKTIFNQNLIDDLKTAQKFIPIKLNYELLKLQDNIQGLFVTNQNGKSIPLRNLITINTIQKYKTLYADRSGEYLGFPIETKGNELTVKERITANFKNASDFNVRFSGNYFDVKALNSELLIVVLVAVLLLYFIMAAQFESLVQPLIILLEIPIDIGGALLLLWLFGGTINIMSAIGIVIMSGIIINDSILKLHTINLLRKEGLSINEAIKQGGRLRLKPILMTSLTTILALSPFLFISGLGAELQRPLALTVIGGMLIGTFISLYFIPLLYKVLSKNQ